MYPIYSRPRQVLLLLALLLFPAGSRELAWIVGAGLVLLALVELAVAKRAMGAAGAARGSDDAAAVPRRTQEAARQQRMEAIGRLSGRFAHELNNQLGVISNSAYLVQRCADDARLARPAQAMLRAVESASLLTRRLQRYGERPGAAARVLDLNGWLPGLEPVLTLVLGRRVALGIGVAPTPLQVHVDPDELELALTGVMLSVREVLVHEAMVRLTALPVEEAAASGLPAGHYAQICVEAWAAWPDGPATPGDSASPPHWAMADASLPPELGLLQGLCRSAGGRVWLRSEPGRCMLVWLALPCAGPVPQRQ